jgi:hypothetical protein
MSSTSSPEVTLTGNPWTTFTMALREPMLLEEPLDLARFFITSLTFMRTMRKIDMLVDDIKVLEVEKSVKRKKAVSRKGLKATSSRGMMTVMSVEETGMIITAKVMQWLAGKFRCCSYKKERNDNPLSNGIHTSATSNASSRRR